MNWNAIAYVIFLTTRYEQYQPAWCPQRKRMIGFPITRQWIAENPAITFQFGARQ